MEIYYKLPFRKFIKKQPRPFQLAIEDEIEKIEMHPESGEAKKGDLSGFRVHKFTFQKQLFLIAYCVQGNSLYVYMIGTHENFYLHLKRYIREVQ